MNVFFTSDTHFNHKNIIEYCDRPFDSIEEHDEYLIEQWNKTVSSKDHVYHLGDFAFWKNNIDPDKIASRLNGKKYLIIGNHDKKLPDKHFTILGHYYELNPKSFDNETKILPIILCHYPFHSWNRAYHGSWHLYGHVHGKNEENDTFSLRMDVGVDSNDFSPVSYDEIETIMDEKAYRIKKMRNFGKEK
jgi:calcineurin-like phosphoesterase family protein